MEIQHCGEAKPPFASRDLGEVGEPNLTGSIGDKVPAELSGPIGGRVVYPSFARRALTAEIPTQSGDAILG